MEATEKKTIGMWPRSATWKDAQLVHRREDRCNNQCVPRSRLVQAIWWRQVSITSLFVWYYEEIVDWLTCLVNLFRHLKVNVKSGGELPHISHIGMCRPIGWGFCAVLLWKRVYTLSILVCNRVWFSRKPRSVWMYLSFQFQMSEKEREIFEFEMGF